MQCSCIDASLSPAIEGELLCIRDVGSLSAWPRQHVQDALKGREFHQPGPIILSHDGEDGEEPFVRVISQLQS